ncbi:hypothetical protein [Flavobacterium soyangense]|uniref:Lipoprotein n=1 Tax=Flavobacterium soyangense TaxID=2023265 RepID=A0A930UDC4_9FLAO|nr:hypothetical protein [Flavobacterium soyangense]MBF2708777.1 hypothetical protein [Flavobacterium soyangense]
MKNLKHIVLLFFSLVVLVSCGSSKPATTENKTQTITVKETVHDTIFKIEKDSSSLKALLECENGKVVIKNIVQSEPGRNLKSPKVQIVDNALRVDCEARAQELLAHYKDTEKATFQTITKTITIEVNKLTFWQQIQIWGFRIYTGLLLLLAIWVYVKSKI